MEEEQVKLIELEWNKAIEKNDVESMSKFMSDEWIIFSGDGNITTKKMFLQLVESGDLIHTKMDFEILNVKSFGNTSLVIIQIEFSKIMAQKNGLQNHTAAATTC